MWRAHDNSEAARNTILHLYAEKWISNCFVKCFSDDSNLWWMNKELWDACIYSNTRFTILYYVLQWRTSKYMCCTVQFAHQMVFFYGILKNYEVTYIFLTNSNLNNEGNCYIFSEWWNLRSFQNSLDSSNEILFLMMFNLNLKRSKFFEKIKKKDQLMSQFILFECYVPTCWHNGWQSLLFISSSHL